MLEAVSLKTLLAHRAFVFESWANDRTWWTREQQVGLALLLRHKVTPDKSSLILGRSPRAMAHYARGQRFELSKEWRDLLTRKQLSDGLPKRDLLAYPYIRDVRGEHADLLRVNALVPHSLPDHLRGDVCQDIMLALFEGQTTLAELECTPALVRKFCATARRNNYEGSGYALSLDMPMPSGQHWYDVLADESEN